jgi:hypothetical protein
VQRLLAGGVLRHGLQGSGAGRGRRHVATAPRARRRRSHYGARPWRRGPGHRCPTSTRRRSRRAGTRVGPCVDSIQRRLGRIEEELAAADPLKRLQLIQERLDLTTELEGFDTQVDLSGLEEDFVKAAAEYSTRKGISYAAWRELGVEPAVLKRAGVKRAAGS